MIPINKPNSPNVLDIFYDTDKIEYKVYDGDKWITMPTYGEEGSVLRISDNVCSWGKITSAIDWNSIEHRPTNCPNCDAPLHSGKCEYCGTEVF